VPSYGQVAAQVRRHKEAHPESYCGNARCLWNLASGSCPKHGLTGAPKRATLETTTAHWRGANKRKES
jgi:hypothetical protein